MTPQELKNSILLLAVQGKITEQLSEDGDTRDLLPKLCIDKSLPSVEEPFDIPENWLWLPIGSLGESTDTDSFCDGPFGSNLKTIHYIDSPEVRIIQLSNIGENGWKDANVKYTSFRHLEEVIPRCEVHPGDLVIAKMMPAGRTIEVPELGTRITLGSDAMKFVPNRILNKQYLLYAMASQAFLGQVYAEAHGITRVRTTLKGIKTYVLPIPPLAEQKRIVAKIEALLPLIERYEKAWSRLEDFNRRFPGDMQKSILQMAIQGKLVDQRPEEGTGEELYRQIHTNDVDASPAKKRGKGKNRILPVPSTDLPFEIPESWVWVRLGTIGYTNIGLTYSPKNVASEGTIVLRSSNIQNGLMDYDDIVRVNMDIPESKICCKGDILICARNGSKRLVGKSAMIDRDGMSFGAFMAIFRSQCNEYILHVINSAYFRNSLLDETGTTTINQITQDMLKNALIPLPPLAEQKRIVARLEELLPLCERLK